MKPRPTPARTQPTTGGPGIDVSDRYRKAVNDRGGAANPYTFVPTPPRADLTDGPGETGLGDAGADGLPSHAFIAPGQWSGTLRVRLTTLTPLLLLDHGLTHDADGLRRFGVRRDDQDRPFIHGASLKGALRSAFETVTASRYGVFGPHSDPLAYRLSTDHGATVHPAVVVRKNGHLAFRICGTGDDWSRPAGADGPVQPAALLTAYPGTRRRPRKSRSTVDKPHVSKIEFTDGRQLPDLHGSLAYARLRLYRMGSRSRNLVTTWVVTHLTDPDLSGMQRLTSISADQDPEKWGASLELVRRSSGRPVPALIARGVVCVTGRSIDTKKHERFFPLDNSDRVIDLNADHQRWWSLTLESYRAAAEYNSVDTAASSRPAGTGLERSWHVRHPDAAETLAHGTPVWVELSNDKESVVGVHPVMIGRKPFAESPDSRLPRSLHPADHNGGLAQLSPADRLFGWTPAKPDYGEDAPGGLAERTSVGYRGRLSIADVRCDADDPDHWRARGTAFRRPGADQGIILSPLSSPKPTQFRFYSAVNDQGDPWPDGRPKSQGYSSGSGLRGRKMYRWRRPESPSYWEPDSAERPETPSTPTDHGREYLALAGTQPSQTIRITDWVRPGVTFTADLRLRGVPSAEMGALMWILSQGDQAPLRLGHGKPLGFGVVRAEILWTDDGEGTHVWNGTDTAERWLSLDTPAPANRAELEDLADRFQAIEHPLLQQAREHYLKAAQATTHPVRYPHATASPQRETFTWFVENERLQGADPSTGWALPHIAASEQRLPHFPPKTERGKSSGRQRRFSGS